MPAPTGPLGSDQVIYYSEKVSNLNLIKDERIQNKELSNLVRAVRRSGAAQDATMTLPRGPVGAGTHDLLVRVSTIGDAGLIAILIFDDSEMRRLDFIRRDFVANISHGIGPPIVLTSNRHGPPKKCCPCAISTGRRIPGRKVPRHRAQTVGYH